jgi:hypothetical protein
VSRSDTQSIQGASKKEAPVITSVTGASCIQCQPIEIAASIFSADFKNPIYIDLALFPAHQEDNSLISNK